MVELREAQVLFLAITVAWGPWAILHIRLAPHVDLSNTDNVVGAEERYEADKMKWSAWFAIVNDDCDRPSYLVLEQLD